jgi:UDP-N-acetyl-D-galactosamine dehydrogenase
VAAVSHAELLSRPVEDIQKKQIKGCCYIDVKAAIDTASLKDAGLCVWRL